MWRDEGGSEAIESVLSTHPKVHHCLVLGVPAADGTRGRRSSPVSRSASGLREEALRDFLLGLLPAWQVPRRWWFVDHTEPTPVEVVADRVASPISRGKNDDGMLTAVSRNGRTSGGRRAGQLSSRPKLFGRLGAPALSELMTHEAMFAFVVGQAGGSAWTSGCRSRGTSPGRRSPAPEVSLRRAGCTDLARPSVNLIRVEDPSLTPEAVKQRRPLHRREDVEVGHWHLVLFEELDRGAEGPGGSPSQPKMKFKE
jgi:hypothetical protein